MKWLKNIIFAPIVCITLFSTINFSQEANDKSKWIIFSPPNKSFSIKLPKLPMQETKLASANKDDSELALFKCSKSIKYYRLPVAEKPSENLFVLREIDISGCSRKESDFEKEIRAFLKYETGKEPEYLRMIKVNEMFGFSVLIDSGEFYTKDSPIKNELLAVNAGKRIYIATNYRKYPIYDREELFRSFEPKFEKNNLIIKETIPINKDKWINYVSSNNSFSMELPKVPTFESVVVKGEELSIFQFFRCNKSGNNYSLSSLSISEIDVSKCKRKDSEFDKEANTLILLFGGDNKLFLSNKKLKIGGLNAREAIFKVGSQTYVRMLIVDAKSRIFVMVYDRLKGYLSEEERLFRTFKPIKSRG
ncbi:MAG TPA: hypothetical protein PKY82_07410 [Pyrinomonadaceae bacterium]|nr:hypothetical protein [Pyrinomonadaceae bacterium]